jgi:pilus assembly protein CpaB
METRRVLIALLLALVVSAVATYFIYVRLGAGRGKPQTIKVVAAARDVSAGAVLKAEDLTTIDWPTNLTLTGSFSKVEEVVGRSPIYPLGQKEPVLERTLAVAGSGVGLTAKIPLGMRASAVRSNEVVGVAGFLYPGSRVDVLATFRPASSSSPVTQTILQDIEVVTAGQKIQPDPQGKPETVNVVTLLLKPEDAEKLTLASSQATVQFVLRSGADKERPQPRAISLDELLGGPKPAETVTPSGKPKAKAKVVAAKTPAVKPPDFYTVEIIHGDKRTTEKFEKPE